MSDVFPILTQRLLLRRFQPIDCDAFVAYRSDPDVARYQSWSDYTRADADQFLIEQASIHFGQLGSWLQIACVEAQSAQLVGDCALHFLSDGKSIELGFTIARQHQGRGYGQEAVQALVRLLLDTLGYKQIKAVTDTRNLPSIHLLESIGFQLQEAKPSPAFFKGEFCQEWTYILQD